MSGPADPRFQLRTTSIGGYELIDRKTRQRLGEVRKKEERYQLRRTILVVQWWGTVRIGFDAVRRPIEVRVPEHGGFDTRGEAVAALAARLEQHGLLQPIGGKA